VVIVAAVGGWLYLKPPPGPTATAVIETPSPPPPTVPERTGSTQALTDATPAGLSEQKPTGGLSEPGKVVIHDPSASSTLRLAYAPEAALVENGPDGPLPRIAADGTRPLDAYARPAEGTQNDMRIAIVIGGVGIDAETSDQAIALPGPVTLALAPYGDHLKETLAEARNAGHELLLQIPLEPFNYPRTDPGPQTLTVDAPPAENLDRLHWLMGRTTNYVGVVNYMGGRFTGEAEAIGPVMQEIGRRGLLYLDDGSSARSRAVELAGTTPVARADIVIDADLSPEAIDARLDQLRALARERGYAIATGTAFPATLDRVAAFIQTAADRGITIVPISALAGASRS
jgi:polysaccharide deacetylase 2 family uncharacterized protein YibQ